MTKTYHQIGHMSQNLVKECPGFNGAVLSPVNYDEFQTLENMSQSGSEFEFLFDPQLYYPRTYRGKLPDWGYIPSGYQTQDESWWEQAISNIANIANRLGIKYVCSPIEEPKIFNESYYERACHSANQLMSVSNGFEVLQTLLVDLDSLGDYQNVVNILNIASGCSADAAYVVFKCTTTTRDQLGDSICLENAIRLISELDKLNVKVTVGYCGLEAVLWSYAGANAVCTGKFLNLRRFLDSSRWKPDDSDYRGGSKPYWTSLEYLTYLEKNDVRRLTGSGKLVHTDYEVSPAHEIVSCIQDNKSWLALSWRRHMNVFNYICQNIQAYDRNGVLSLIHSAQEAWKNTKTSMDRRENTGEWLDAWRSAIINSAVDG